MQINTMISQLAGGMLVSTEIFVVTLVFSLPLGLLIAFGRMSKNKVLQAIVKHLYHARNSVNAAADGRLFWTVLSVWH